MPTMSGWGGAAVPTTADNPDYWRKRANEARQVAARMHDPKMKSTKLRLAENYDQIAQLTEERLRAWSNEDKKGRTIIR